MVSALLKKIFNKTQEDLPGIWENTSSSNWYKYYNPDGTFRMAVSKTCLESFPCQHYVSFSEDCDTSETWDINDIEDYLKERNIPLCKFHKY